MTGGHVGVAATTSGAPGALTAGFDSRVGVGQVLLAQAVTLRDRAATGELGANQITVGANVTTGPRSAFVAPPAAPVPGAFTVGTTAINVNAGQTLALAPGKYGAVTVAGTLNLSGGLYEIQSLRLQPDARVTALAAATVRIATGLAAGDRCPLAARGAAARGEPAHHGGRNDRHQQRLGGAGDGRPADRDRGGAERLPARRSPDRLGRDLPRRT